MTNEERNNTLREENTILKIKIDRLQREQVMKIADDARKKSDAATEELIRSGK
jgi:hypothetical protein